MRLDRRGKLLTIEGKQGIFLEGTCQIGHKRRCPNTLIEPAVSLGDESEIEAAFVGMGVFIGRKAVLRRVESLGRFSVIGEGCRVGVLEPKDMEAFSNALPLRDNQLLWSRELLPVAHPQKRSRPGRVRIGNDVLVGEVSLILEGVSIGDGAIVRPGSVVGEDVPPYGIFSGNPGKLEGFRFPEELARRLEALGWWEYGTRLLETAELEKLEVEELLGELEKEAGKRQRLPYGGSGFWFCHRAGMCSVYAGKREPDRIVETALEKRGREPFFGGRDLTPDKRRLLLQFPDN